MNSPSPYTFDDGPDPDTDVVVDLPPQQQQPQVLIREVPVTDDLIKKLAEALLLSVDRVDLPDARFHGVVIPDAGEPITRDFATAWELATFLRGYEGQDVRVRAFYGRPCGLTRRPHYLVTHEGRYPLFDESEGDEIDPAGFLGKAAGPPAPASGPPDVGPDLDGAEIEGDDLLDEGDDAVALDAEDVP